jgi:hypothetical protein
MMLWHTIWETFVHLLEESDRIRVVLEGLFFLVTVCFVAVGWLPSPRLLRRVLFDGQALAWLWAMREMKECLETLVRIAPPTHLLSLRNIRRAVRVWVEYEIFHHHRPHEILEFEPWRMGWWKTFFGNRRQRRKARDKRVQALRQLVEGGVPRLRVDTCFDLQDDDVRHIRTMLDRYFKTVTEDPKYPADRFICTLVITTGYVAPLHLLAGLLAHFNKEWVPVINDFGEILTRHDDPLRNTPIIRHLQAFIFDCWLIWGPSIPLCRCAQFTHGEVEALQLGYGDENNSLPLISTAGTLLKDFDRLLAQMRSEGGEPPFSLALQVVVTGTLRWGSSVPSEETPPALRSIRDGIVLEYIKMTPFVGERAAERNRVYYSAYLWIIFVVLDAAGKPVFPRHDTADLGETWRGLLPFFEHGNIADGMAYDFLKHQLARKAMAALQRLVGQTSGWRFGYACAFDDPGCTPSMEDSRRFPEPAPSMPLRRICEDLLATEFPGLADSGRVSVAQPLGRDFSACHLNEVIEAFYVAAGHSRRGIDIPPS